MKVMVKNGLKKYSVEVLENKSKREIELRNKSLHQFINHLNGLVDEFHQDIYLRDDIFNALGLLISVVMDEMDQPKIVVDLEK